MFDVRSFKAKNRVFKFDHQQMNTFEFVQCSKHDVRVRPMCNKMVFDQSLVGVCVPTEISGLGISLTNQVRMLDINVLQSTKSAITSCINEKQKIVTSKVTWLCCIFDLTNLMSGKLENCVSHKNCCKHIKNIKENMVAH